MEAWIQKDFSDREFLASRGRADLRLMTKGFLGMPKCVYVTPFTVNDTESLKYALQKLLQQAEVLGYTVDLNKTDTKQ